jgi:hypothetical protein
MPFRRIDPALNDDIGNHFSHRTAQAVAFCNGQFW